MWVAGAADGRLALIWDASRASDFTAPDFESSKYSFWIEWRGWPGMGQPRLPLVAEVLPVYDGQWAVVLSCWYVALFLAVLPLWWIVRRRRAAKRAMIGGCLHCGYSLTGNTSGTCPECGTAIPKASRPA